MSKSVGNVVRPDALVDAFGVDALRWHLISEMSFGQDASFSDEAFLVRYNSDLANGLGNTLSRAVRMASDAFGGTTPGRAVRRQRGEAGRRGGRRSPGTPPSGAAACTRPPRRSARSSAPSTATSPRRSRGRSVKAEGVTPALHRIHYNALEGLRVAAVMLAPIAPGASAEVLRRLGTPKTRRGAPPVRPRLGRPPARRPARPRRAPLPPRRREGVLRGTSQGDPRDRRDEARRRRDVPAAAPAAPRRRGRARAPAPAAAARPLRPPPSPPASRSRSSSRPTCASPRSSPPRRSRSRRS